MDNLVEKKMEDEIQPGSTTVRSGLFLQVLVVMRAQVLTVHNTGTYR